MPYNLSLSPGCCAVAVSQHTSFPGVLNCGQGGFVVISLEGELRQVLVLRGVGRRDVDGRLTRPVAVQRGDGRPGAVTCGRGTELSGCNEMTLERTEETDTYCSLDHGSTTLEEN